MPPLEECVGPSINRFKGWLASGEGPTVPATESPLDPDGEGLIANASFTRPAAQWSGGDKWHLAIPSTGGQVATAFFPFEASSWEERLGPPPHTFEEALADASGFTIVGNTQNELSFEGLRIDGFTPDCKEP